MWGKWPFISLIMSKLITIQMNAKPIKWISLKTTASLFRMRWKCIHIYHFLLQWTIAEGVSVVFVLFSTCLTCGSPVQHRLHASGNRPTWPLLPCPHFIHARAPHSWAYRLMQRHISPAFASVSLKPVITDLFCSWFRSQASRTAPWVSPSANRRN